MLMSTKIIYPFITFYMLNGAMMPRNLKEYTKKRDFDKTTEPKAVKKSSSAKNMFVVQKHDASHLHYDLRLEIDGVLVSWAVPKGPSMDPSIKHLAIMTEDHPLDYGHFEGVIPEGNYGAGTVMVWDTGTYENIKTADDKLVPMTTCLKKGTIEVMLHGKKLKGGFVLIHTDLGDSEKNWLLKKIDDEYASTQDVLKKQKSALSDKTMKQIAAFGVLYEK